MFEITDRTAAPYSAICYLRVVFPDGSTARGSAVIVGPNDVLTALHVVYQVSHGGWARLVDLVPGADSQPFTAPFGHFTDFGSLDGRAANWDFNGDGRLSLAESAGDLALIGMDSRIGDITGWLPVSRQPNDFLGMTAGYPAAGTGMMAEQVSADALNAYGVYDIPDNLGSGASGGPLLAGSGASTSVVGVLSSGATDGSLSTYAGLFSSETWAWLDGAMSRNDRLIADVPVPVTRQGSDYVGTGLTERWIGSTGWDTFTGNSGDDIIDGAKGVDTCVYGGDLGSYDVTASGGIVSVTDHLIGRDGADTLRNVERLKFADLCLAFDVQGSAGQAYRLYQAAFNRAPDLPGLGFQMDALDEGLTLTQLASNFLDSPEFERTYHLLDDRQYVLQLYQNVLHRTPAESEVAYHLDDMHVYGASRAQVLAHFSESPENQLALIGIMQNGMVYSI